MELKKIIETKFLLLSVFFFHFCVFHRDTLDKNSQADGRNKIVIYSLSLYLSLSLSLTLSLSLSLPRYRSLSHSPFLPLSHSHCLCLRCTMKLKLICHPGRVRQILFSRTGFDAAGYSAAVITGCDGSASSFQVVKYYNCCRIRGHHITTGCSV